MPQPLIDRADEIFREIADIQDFEESVKRELHDLSKLTDDVALVMVGHLYIEKKCIDVLAAFFNYDPARSRLNRITSYSHLINLLRLTNICSEKILDALDFLGTLRNRFAHDIVSLTLLEREILGSEISLSDKFQGLCKGFNVEEDGTKGRFMDLLKRIYVELRKAELLAKEINRFTNSREFIDSLMPIKV